MAEIDHLEKYGFQVVSDPATGQKTVPLGSNPIFSVLPFRSKIALRLKWERNNKMGISLDTCQVLLSPQEAECLGKALLEITPR